MNFKAVFISFLTLVVFSTPQKGSAQKSELSSDFHRERRLQLREKLPSNSVAVFFSSPIRNRANDVDFEYHPDPNFYYLTGWNEPHAVLFVYSVPQNDAQGTYYEKLYIRERDARNEMWNGKRLGLEGAKKMGFDRVDLKQNFINEPQGFDQFDTVFMFDFKNDVRDTSDPSDLFDLKKQFKQAIHFPENFDAKRYRLYQRIRKAKPEEVPSIQ